MPLDLEEAGARRFFPELLQETAAAFSPSKTDGKEDSAGLKETGAGGLTTVATGSSWVAAGWQGATAN
jgi:hypothetical protein